jgi:NitT/TauT family transport system permease protein
MRRQFSSGWIAFLIVIVFFLSWESIVRLWKVPTYLLPAPSQVLATLIAHPSLYFEASVITFGEALLGLLCGVTVGALTAILLTFWPRLENGVMTLAILIKSTPLVAIAPLLTLWLGFGWQPKVVITALVTFFPVLINVLVGLQNIEPSLLELFRSWRANRWELLFYLRLPHSLPYIFAALKVSTPLALIGAVVAEWTGASGGLGRTMWLAYTNLNLPYLFAAIFILATAGMGLYLLTARVEKHLVFWYTTTHNV